MYYTIYKITNKINNKIYIGKHQTNNLDDGYMGSGKLLKSALNKYGIENFSKEILFVLESEELMNAKEAELVSEEFCSHNTNYNLCPGGQGGWGYINSNGLTDAAIIGRLGGIKNKGKENPTLKRLHAEGKIQYAYYKDVEKYNSLLKDARERARSEDAITKRKNTYKSIGHSIGEKNSQFGSMWITNGEMNKKIKKSDSIPDGWNAGRIIKR